MNVIVESKGDITYISIQGDPELKCLDKLGKAFDEISRIDTMKHVIIDLKAVNSINAKGMEKFILFYKSLRDNQKDMEIKGVSENVYQQFLGIRFDNLITIQSPYNSS